MTKAKRKLADIDFTKESAHVALVSKTQGGPANGHAYSLVLKSGNYSKEFIQKVQQVQVTLDLPDFLRKFFGLYSEDAEVLARFFGYVKPEVQEVEYDNNWYENYIQEKVDSFKVLKSLHEAPNIAKALVELSEDEYLAMLKDQVTVEKALAEIENTSTGGSTIVEDKVEPSGSKVTKSEGKTKMDEVVELQKSLDIKAAELQTALDLIKSFEQKEKENVTKAKTSKVEAVVKNEKAVAALVKAGLALETEEDFNAFTEALAALQAEIASKDELINKSALFNEEGVTAEQTESPAKESAVAKLIKANLKTTKA
jgi:hypothetical protein